MVYMHSQEAIIVFNRFIKLIFISSEQVRLRERETMLHSFRREDENLKFDINSKLNYSHCVYVVQLLVTVSGVME